MRSLKAPSRVRDPEPYADNQNKIIAKIKDGLVLVGVLPNPAKQYLVKRVIGVAGDNVVGKDGVVTINGKKITEPYIFAGNKASEIDFNITVPEGKIWVMGDHRGASADSRYHQDLPSGGFVDESFVVGRAVVVSWPIENWIWLDNYPDTFSDIPKP